jgi:alcohol dehydrogenase (cytochrome c)
MSKRVSITRGVSAVALCAWVSAAGAQQGNPFEADPAAIRAGRTLFASRCAICHDADAKGAQGPDLTVLWMAGKSDAQVFESVRRGVENTVMPPSAASDEEIWAIVAYLRSIGTVPPFTSDRGDAAQGREIFASTCASCHRAEGGGGALGPDLSRIALIRSREALVSAIREPSAAIDPAYRTVTLVAHDGERIEGIAKGEDAFSIQIIDNENRLQGYLKADLADVVAESESLMPAYGQREISKRELDDLLAFLGTLREAGAAGAGADGALVGAAGVTDADLRAGLADATRWLTFSGDYSGQRHSPLRQITPENVHRLRPIWISQSGTYARGRGFETTPLIFDGVLYVTGPNNFAWALDARTGRRFWEYRRELPNDLTYGATAPVNRGFGILGDRLFMVTLDAHLLALDRRTGAVLWDVALADYHVGYSATHAPLVVGGKVIVGISGGEYATRGFLGAYDPDDGTRLWRFNTIPEPGEPGSETWPSTEVMARGGGGTWMTGSYDPELDLVYWGTGNPNPDFYGADRAGDNLFTASIVAIEVQTGKLRWHYQFTPHDTHDWDSNHVPVLAELTIAGEARRVVMVANRNGFFYVLDRTNGELLLARPFTDTTWAREIGHDGRPIVLDADGSRGCLPDVWGGTNFMPPSFDPTLRLFFVTARETCASFHPEPPELVAGQASLGGVAWADRRFRPYGALRAIDVTTGERRWEFRHATPTMAGVMSTASGLVFAGDNAGNFIAFDSRTGKNLWHYATGASIWGAAAMTHMLDGRQHVLIPSGSALIAFALGDE